MRIISQDRNVDLPYDACVLTISRNNNKSVIKAWSLSFERSFPMASYTTEEIAYRNMDKAHKACSQMDAYFQFPDDYLSGGTLTSYGGE